MRNPINKVYEEKVSNTAPKPRQRVRPTLFVIFAAEANAAVIFRRGPSAWFHVIRWDTLHDVFVSGAWFRGRIYAEKCDLSPNGELLLCFMHQGRKFRTDYSDSWSAISRSPWLHALWLWPQGTTYGGGGRFTDNRNVVVRQYSVAAATEAHPGHPGFGLNIAFEPDYQSIPLHASSGEVEEADWSGRDQTGRLIYSIAGRLFVKELSPTEDRCLADFSDCVPEPALAPEFAMVTLPPEKRDRSNRKRVAKTRKKP
jgi:hypothetical protein